MVQSREVDGTKISQESRSRQKINNRNRPEYAQLSAEAGAICILCHNIKAWPRVYSVSQPDQCLILACACVPYLALRQSRCLLACSVLALGSRSRPPCEAAMSVNEHTGYATSLPEHLEADNADQTLQDGVWQAFDRDLVSVL